MRHRRKPNKPQTLVRGHSHVFACAAGAEVWIRLSALPDAACRPSRRLAYFFLVAERDRVGLRVGVLVCDDVPVLVFDRVGDRVAVAVWLPVLLGVAVFVGLRLGVPDRDTVGSEVVERVDGGVSSGDGEGSGVGTELRLGETAGDTVGAPEALRVAVAVTVPLSELLGVSVLEVDGVCELLPVGVPVVDKLQRVWGAGWVGG